MKILKSRDDFAHCITAPNLYLHTESGTNVVLDLALSLFAQSHNLTFTFFIVDYLILWLSCPLFLEWLAHLQDCKCGNTPCDLTPAILARLLQTFSHADLIKYSLEVAQRKMILDPIFLPLKSPDILITPKGKLKDKKVIHFTVEQLYLLTFDTNVVKISILEYHHASVTCILYL